uniref:Uncharacterized protein n=1 Tax=Anguilla anguilla TaxID=7936 RepID=A0A0E9WT23_ANGAN
MTLGLDFSLSGWRSGRGSFGPLPQHTAGVTLFTYQRWLFRSPLIKLAHIKDYAYYSLTCNSIMGSQQENIRNTFLFNDAHLFFL